MKLAFLFIIYDKIEKEDIWYNFFKDVDINLYTIYIHSKYPDNTKLNDFFTKYLVKDNYKTSWGTYSQINLQNRLLELSIQDDNNYKFIFMSGAHIPLHNFYFIYNTLTCNNNSIFSYFAINKKIVTCYDRKNKTNNLYLKYLLKINPKYKKIYNITKWNYGSSWCILNKDHTNFILNNEKTIKDIFDKCHFCDEYAYLNYLLSNNKTNIINKATTYHNFKVASNKKYRKLPHTFEKLELTDDLLNTLKPNYLFVRKVTEDTIVNENLIFKNIEPINDFFSQKELFIDLLNYFTPKYLLKKEKNHQKKIIKIKKI